MRALCLVAHPDDCALFGYKFITDHNDWDWQIWYLTYHDHSERVEELRQFWDKRAIPVSAGGFPDQWEHVSKGEIGFDRSEAEQAIKSTTRDHDVLLTHNAAGEYGHPHHLFIHDIVKDLDVPKIYFGTFPEHCNLVLKTDDPLFDSSELPMHKSVVDGFDLTSWKYLITPEAADIVKYSYERS